LLTLHTDKGCELLVCVQDAIAMDQYGLMDSIAKGAKERHWGWPGGCSGFRLGSDPRQQVINRRTERGNLGLVRVQIDAAGQTAADRNASNLLRQLVDCLELATLENVQDKEKRCDERQQQAKQPND